MDKDFEQAARALDARLAAPVKEERRKWEPTRVELLKVGERCDALAARIRPLGMDVQARVTFATNRGVRVPGDVLRHLREGFGLEFFPGLLANAGATCRQKAQQIEQLTADDLYQDIPRYFAKAVEQVRPLLGRLEWLEGQFKRDLDLLTDLVRRADVSRPAVAVVESRPAPVGPKVETRIRELEPGAPIR